MLVCLIRSPGLVCGIAELFADNAIAGCQASCGIAAEFVQGNKCTSHNWVCLVDALRGFKPDVVVGLAGTIYMGDLFVEFGQLGMCYGYRGRIDVFTDDAKWVVFQPWSSNLVLDDQK